MATITDNNNENPNTVKRVAVLLAVLLLPTLLHVCLIFRFPLAPDETYYWEWSRRLAWGYYDQGPMVAWWIRATCILFGDNAFGLRIGIVVAALLTRWYLYLFARDMFNERIALISQIPFAITPLALVGSFIATYDPLVVLFWTAGMYYAQKALIKDERDAWYGLGISFGLGMLSKHTMAVFGLSLLIFVFAIPEQRAWLRRKEPYLAFLLGMLIFSPNIWWQMTHDWMTFAHLFMLTGKGTDHAFIRRLGDFVGSQFALMTPFLFIGMVGALIWAAREGRKPGKQRLWFLFAFAVPLIIFTLFTVKSKVQANWAICGWLTPPVAYIAWLDERSKQVGPKLRWPKRLHITALVTCSILSILLVAPEARRVLHIKFPPKWDQMNKLYGGAELATAVDDVRNRMYRDSNTPLTVGAATYDTTSRLAFYLPVHPKTYCFFLGTRQNSYAAWNYESRPKKGENALVVDDRPPDDPLLPAFHQVFERVEAEPAPVQIYRRGVYSEPVHTYYLYRCYNYRPSDKLETPHGG